jgi:hypothetical protein
MAGKRGLIMRHKQRCETCTHHKLVGRIPDIDNCDIMDHILMKEEKEFIEKMGCGSYYSNAPADTIPYRIEKDGFHFILPGSPEQIISLSKHNWEIEQNARDSERRLFTHTILSLGSSDNCPDGVCRRDGDKVHDPWGCVKCISEYLHTPPKTKTKDSELG